MNWKIFNISIPVKDLRESIKFYEMLLGERIDSDDMYRNIFKDEVLLGGLILIELTISCVEKTSVNTVS